MPSERTPEPMFLTSTEPFPFKIGEILKKGTKIKYTGGILELDYDMEVSSKPIGMDANMLYQITLKPID
jgi:hypothetical protein